MKDTSYSVRSFLALKWWTVISIQSIIMGNDSNYMVKAVNAGK
jgi:hypothetical protein